jgi:hypothetical protein
VLLAWSIWLLLVVVVGLAAAVEVEQVGSEQEQGYL